MGCCLARLRLRLSLAPLALPPTLRTCKKHHMSCPVARPDRLQLLTHGTACLLLKLCEHITHKECRIASLPHTDTHNNNPQQAQVRGSTVACKSASRASPTLPRSTRQLCSNPSNFCSDCTSQDILCPQQGEHMQ